MEELIKAIYDLGQPTLEDHILFAVNVISVIISTLALIAAIRIPKQIGKSQNDIALFEKRYQLYKSLCPLINFADDLSKIKDKNLIDLNTQTRARHYLLLYVLSEDQNFNEENNLSSTFKFLRDDNHELWGYEIIPSKEMDMEVYKLHLRRHIDTNKKTIELTSFLFPKDIEKLLQKLVLSYATFMNFIYRYSKLDHSIPSKIPKDAELQNLMYQNCDMEKSKRDFLSVIKELSDKNTLEKIKNNLRLKEL